MNKDDDLIPRAVIAGWPFRVKKAIEWFHITTWSELQAISDEKWLRVNGFGRTSLVFVWDQLQARGLTPRVIPTPVQSFYPLPKAGVYFIRGGDLVKIGIATHVTQRFAQIQRGCPVKLTLIGLIPEPYAKNLRPIEKAIHDQFAALRMHGEWFRYESPLIEYVEPLASAVA